MTSRSMTPLLRHLREITSPARASGVGDGELLERFVRQRDEIAFELLVWRHQRMVLGVCRRVLLDGQEAEDAFQAAFLALAQRAATVCRYRSVAGWLHNVAYHVALRARKRSARQATTELSDANIESCHDPAEAAARREIAALLDEEVSRLPDKYRLPVVLCYLEGQTYQEAGRQLGVPVGTLSARLTRGRSLLRSRLTRRGIGVSGALLAVLLCEQASSAAAGATLVKAAAALATGHIPSATSASIAALAESAMGSMVVSKVKIAMAIVLAGCLLAGMGLLIPAGVAPPPTARESTPSPPAAAAERKKPPHVDRYGDALPADALFRFGSVRLRHDGGIRASSLSPDGKLLATTSGYSVILWDLETNKPLRRFVTDHHWHFCTPGLTFAPDGRHLGYVQCDDFGCIWDVKSGKQLAEFVGDRRHPHALCQFTPDSKTFIMNDEKRVAFWDVHNDEEARTVRVDRVSLLSPDARFCVRVEENRVLIISDARTGKETARLEVAAAHNGLENGIAFAPDGKALAVVHQHKEVQLRDFPSGKVRLSFPLPESAHYRINNQDPKDRDRWEYNLFVSSDGQEILLGTKAGLIHHWDIAAEKELPPMKKHIGAVAGVHTLPDGKTILTTGADGLIRRWDRTTGQELSEPPGYVGHTHAAYAVDGRLAAVGDARGHLDLWDARNGRLLQTLRQEGPAVTKLLFTPDGKMLAAAQADNNIHLWAIPSGMEQRLLSCGKEQDLSHQPWTMQFSPNGRRLLLADVHYHARVWDLTSGEVCWRGGFGAGTFLADGKTVIGEDGPYLQFFDATNGKKKTRVRLKTSTPDNFGIISAIAASADGRRLAVGLHSGDVYLCDARTGEEIQHFHAVDPPRGTGHIFVMLKDRGMRPVRGLAFSADGKWLCTSGGDGSVRLWEVVTAKEVLRCTGHRAEVGEVSFGADSGTILSCGEDAQAYLWSLRPPMRQESKSSLDSLWADLSDEPAKAYRATWAFSEAEDAAAFLHGKLVPVKPVPEERLKKLIADLESETFVVRESAAKKLNELGDLATPSMREALAALPPLETRKRLEAILKRIEAKTLSAKELRTWRAIDALERMGTAEARESLRALADGAPGALSTMAAREALNRQVGE